MNMEKEWVIQKGVVGRDCKGVKGWKVIRIYYVYV